MLQVGRIGDLVRRVDATPKTTGEFAYSSDLYAAGMLWGHTVRSPHPHARVRSVDISQALTMPGVHAVLTHADVPGAKRYGLEFPDQPVLAIDRVRYVGEPVALVAAEHPEQARRAAERIAVDYEPLEPVVDMERALEQAPIHEERWTEGHGYREDDRPNVLRTLVIRHGDPEAEGDVSVRRLLRDGDAGPGVPRPRVGPRRARRRGRDRHLRATQWLHVDRDQVAPCLGLEPERVRLHLAGVGGAFGGREDLSMQIHAAMLALHTDRPVKMVYGRDESFVGHVHRHPARIWCEHRARRDGKLVNVRMRILLDGGAYASSSTAVALERGLLRGRPVRGRERADRVDRRLHEQPPCGAMRGFGAVQTCFAAEAQMDTLAAELGLDPVELRLRNALAPGDVLPTGQRIAGSLPVADVIAAAPRSSRRPRRSCRATRSAFPAGPGTRRAARASAAASASRSGSRTSRTPRASTTRPPPACGSTRTAAPRSTAPPRRSARA